MTNPQNIDYRRYWLKGGTFLTELQVRCSRNWFFFSRDIGIIHSQMAEDGTVSLIFLSLCSSELFYAQTHFH